MKPLICTTTLTKTDPCLRTIACCMALFAGSLLAPILLKAAPYEPLAAATCPITDADDEYERYKRDGDELFKKGEYEKAQKKYQACLEVPNFANDAYAKGKIEQTKKASQLRQSADAAFSRQRGTEAIELLKQILVINPDDPITQKSIADFWEKEGNQKFESNDYEAAKNRYQEALKYSGSKTTLQLLIQTCTDKLQLERLQRAAQLEKEGDDHQTRQAFDKAIQRYQEAQKIADTPALQQKIRTATTKLEEQQKRNNEIAYQFMQRGQELFAQQKYAEAKKQFEEALRIADDKTFPQQKINECDQKLGLSPTSKPPITLSPAYKTENPQTAPATKPIVQTHKPGGAGLKILTGAVAVGAGVYAYMLNSQWKSKLNTLNEVSQKYDPDGDGQILVATAFAEWQTANNEAKTAQSKHGLFVACVGVATGAALLETYLLIRKPNPARNVSFRPASHQPGLAIQYRF